MQAIQLILFTMMIVTAISYAVIVVPELMEGEYDELEEKILFVTSAILYVIIALWLIKSKNVIPLAIIIAGNIFLIILYFMAVTDAAESVLGLEEVEEVSKAGLTIKMLQGVIIILSFIQIRNVFTHPNPK